jgi:hypothetical protein
MAEPSPQHDNSEVNHEHSDVNVSGVIKFAVGLIVFAVVAHLVLALLFGVLARRTDRDQPQLPPVARQERERERLEAEKRLKAAAKDPDSRVLPRPPIVYERLRTIPAPRLQINDEADMVALRAREEAALKASGWVDEKAGIARIPIGEAMRLVADPKTAAALGIRVRGATGSPGKGKQDKGGR